MISTLIGVSVVLCALASSASAAEDGQISGRVISATTKAPIEGIEPCASVVNGRQPGTCTVTNANGEYTLPSLSAGEYLVTFVVHNPKYDYQYYNHKYDFSEAEPVVVVAGGTTAGIDGELGEVGGSFDGELSGRVTDASTEAPIEGIEVCADEYNPSKEGLEEGTGEACVTTGANGEYAISGLPPGEYVVEFTSPVKSALNYVTQYYSAKSSFSEATRVSLPPLTTKYHIDAELSVGGWIAGRVTNASTGAANEEALVCALQSNSEIGGCAITNANGEYTIPALAPGDYVVEFVGGPGGYLAQYYDDSYAASEERLVVVVAEATTAGIDAALQPGAFRAPVASAPPSVSGTAAVGDTLSCASGSWTANPPPSFAYMWLRDGAPIASATQSAYVVQASDVGHGLSCEVEATSRAVGRKGVARALSSTVAITAGSPSPPSPPGSSSVAGPPATPAPFVALKTSRVVLAKGAAHVWIVCEHASCRGSLELLVQAGTRLDGGRRVVLATGYFSLAEGRSTTVTLRLNGAGVRRLTHLGARHVRAQITALVRAGKPTTETVVVL